MNDIEKVKVTFKMKFTNKESMSMHKPFECKVKRIGSYLVRVLFVFVVGNQSFGSRIQQIVFLTLFNRLIILNGFGLNIL